MVAQWAPKTEHVYWCVVCDTGQCRENQGWQRSGLVRLDEQACPRTEVRCKSEDRLGSWRTVLGVLEYLE